MPDPEHDIDLTAADSVGRLVARARRVADLSQRELAARVGVSGTAISRLESGAGLPSLPLLAAILKTAGLRLRVTDENDEAVVPVPATIIRDNGGRRFPAHLDVAPPDEIPAWARRSPRYDRARPPGWYHHRAERDRLLALQPEVARQGNHPTRAELADREQRRHRRPSPSLRLAPLTITCTCPDACYDDDEVVGCLPTCSCQCEPPLS